MTVIAQISDIHFGSEGAGEAEALVEELNREQLDLVILSGDLTMAARRREFEKARDFIAAIEAPTLSVPGNHDITPYHLLERFVAPYRRWRAFIGAELEPSWSNGTAAVVGINTARRMRFRLDWSHGSVSRGQLRALSPRFAALGACPFRIVVAHHPFLEEDTPDLGKRPRVMVARARDALEAFARHDVDLVVAGHLHRTYAAFFEGPPTAGQAHRVTTVQAGTALSARVRGEANSFNVIRIEDGRLAVHRVARRDRRWQVDSDPLVAIDKAATR
ncbi:MAG: metallophosphoesterase [Acuticoccus sp.]